MIKTGAQHRLLEAMLHKDPKFAKPGLLNTPAKNIMSHAKLPSNKSITAGTIKPNKI